MCPNDDRILVLAPTGQDAPLICDELKGVGLCAVGCATLDQFAGAVGEGAAAGLIAEEALDPGALPRLIEALNVQPAWSDLPLLVLTGSEVRHDPGTGELTRQLADIANVSLLERPSRVLTLLMAVRAAVRTRRRQYDFREYLQQFARYQEHVRQTQKLESLGVLAGGIAHDFNNILTGILGNASLAAEILPAGHPVRPLVDDVVTASERAAGLTTQMLAYAGKGQFVVRRVDLSALVRKLTDFFRASVPKRVELAVQLAAELPSIEADSSQLEQVVMNLVINAAEAIPEGRSGTVQVRTYATDVGPETAHRQFHGDPPRPGKYVVLQVTDDGSGMDEATLARIFDPFFTTKFMGRGLGLAALQGIVRGHQGALNVESHPGRGTCFSVFLPVATHSAAVEGRASEKLPDDRVTILVVDDEEVVRSTATSLLEQRGYAVVTAENGKVGVDVFRKLGDRVDAVLLDMTMPVMDGEEALRELKAIRPDAKVILTSGYDEAEAVRRFADAGLAGFIQKPYTSSRLAEKIKRTLESGGDRRNPSRPAPRPRG
jgi:signal transduction histidine kinase/ActR/RegA family two-component response regulator